MKNYVISGFTALVVSVSILVLMPNLIKDEKTLRIEHVNGTPVRGALYTINERDEVVPLDFTAIAEKVMDAVVHIKATQKTNYVQKRNQYQTIPDPFRDFFDDDFFDQFFGPRYYFKSPENNSPGVKVSSGSGVIINKEGYIVTNNHVIANADDLEVTLSDNRTFKATVVGTDPSTDLALIQIKENDLPYLPLVNSDEVKIGEWVLAVGNPFNLNSTVTAGIVSAKSRNINILKDQYAIESFIQTDAAINPGNSGGALVNLQGGLVGINTAIASPTGAYAGYGFAVPSNMVSKVIEDLMKYGVVQRGYLGVTIRSVDGNLSKKENLKSTRGVFIDSVAENSAAEEAGIMRGDVILKVNETSIENAAELQEIIARHRPGDSVTLQIMRGEEKLTLEVKLKNKEGETKFLTKNKYEIFNILGADFETLDKERAKELEIEGGVKVIKLYAGKLSKHTDMREGFIITKIDGKLVDSVEDLAGILEGKKGGILIEGIYEDLPGSYYYAIGL